MTKALGRKTDAALASFLMDRYLPPQAANAPTFFDVLLDATQRPLPVSSALHVFRAGWNSPPAVGRASDEPASALPPPGGRGQQTRSNAGADGHSPDERERFAAAFACLRVG